MKRIQLEPWTTWEKLCLVNAVQRTGDQNWTAVSRAVRNIYDDTSIPLSNDNRPPHWFSMKQCAAQYETLLNHVLGSRRKKRTERSFDSSETPPDIIYNVLKNELLEEIDRKMEDERIQHKKLRKKHDDIMAGLYDDILEEMLHEDSKEKERDIKLKLKFKLGEKNAERNLSPLKTYTPNNAKAMEVKPPGSSTSPLLTSLLQSPSQHSLPSVPSISLLLNSASSSIPSNESPTLTKLLESPSSKVPIGASTLEAALRPSPIRPTTPIDASPLAPKLTPIRSSPMKVDFIEERKKEVSPKIDKSRDEIKPPVLLPEKRFDTVPHVVESEIIIEEDLHHEREKSKDTSKTQVEVIEEEEVTESVEEILEKLKVSIIETVGGNDSDQDVTSENIEHIVNLEEQADEDEDSREAKSKDLEEEEKDSPQVTSAEGDESTVETDEQSRSDGQTEETQASLDRQNRIPVKARQSEDNLTNDETDDHVQIDLLDQEAVEIIVMGSNSNSVINVLGQDSSSEDVTQSSGLEEGKEFNPETGDEESKTDQDEDGKCLKSEEEDSKQDSEKDNLSKSPLKDQTDEDSGDTSDTILNSNNQPTQMKTISTNLSKEYMPEVMVTLEPIEQMMLGSSKSESKTPVVEKLKKTHKRSSTYIDSKPSSPASSSFNDDEKEYRAWKKSVLLVFSRIASHKYASVFSKPIIDAAGYKNLIKCPMDLSTIKKNIETGVIRTTTEFQRDVLLMIQNAVMYNPTSSFVYNMALEMWVDVINEMNVMVQALGDGVPLGRTTGESNGASAPTRSGRQAKLSIDKKKQDGNTPKRRRLN